MGRVAVCGRNDCQGSLAPMFDKNREQKGFYCERCSTVFEDVAVDDGVPRGVKPSGRINEQEEIREREAHFERTIREQRALIDSIAELVADDKSEIGKLIKAEIGEKVDA